MIFQRKTAALLASLALTGCGSSQDTLQIPKLILSGLATPDQGTAGPDAATIKAALSPEILARVDGPLLIAQIPSRDSVALLTKAGSNQGVDTFLSADGVSISLRNGMIVATRGLGFDLMLAEVDDALNSLNGTSRTAVRKYHRLDGENHLVADDYRCVFATTGQRQLKEICTGPMRTFENTYAIDKNEQIIASHQWVTPQLGWISIELIE